MQSPELLEKTASERLTLEKEYEMQQSWLQDEDKCTFIILDAAKLEHCPSEIDAMAGDINLFLNDPNDHQVAEIEIMIAEPSSRRKGIGEEALMMMMQYGIYFISVTILTSHTNSTQSPYTLHLHHDKSTNTH
jgi:RimJ/RimL family protein N-acetyltransferase